MPRCACRAAVTGLILAVVGGIAANAADVTIYEETFPSPGAQPPTQDQQLRIEGWCGGNAGDQFCNNPPGTVANQGGEGAISVGAGQGGSPGFAFWSQKGINADSFLYTEEVSGTSRLSAVTWYQRDSGSEPLHLAFKIGSTWYVSDQVWTQPDSSQWLQQTADVPALTFFTRTQIGTTLPDGSVPVTSPAVSLPLDQPLAAFGFWWNGPKGNTSRIDTVRLAVSDTDIDGVGDDVDACLPSSGVGQPVIIDGCSAPVVNPVDAEGCTIDDRIDRCAQEVAGLPLNYRRTAFVACVTKATKAFRKAGLIGSRDEYYILRCAWQATP